MALRFTSLLVGIVVLASSVCVRAQSSGWQIIKVADRDYLSAQNIAEFYQLRGGLRMVDHRLSVGDARASLEFGGNPREIYVNGVKQWLSFPVVVQNGQTLVSRLDLAKTIEPCLRPTFISTLQPFHTVVIDAGHGGQDRGASSAAGDEKNYALSVIQELKKSLEARGLKVILTRANDSYLSLEERAQKANETSDAVFVSIHFNSETNGTGANGFEVYAMTPRGAASTGESLVSAEQFKMMPGNHSDDASLAFATCVQHSLLGHMPEQDRGVRRARFAVLRLTRAPAILIEGGFLTNAPDGQKINNPAWRRKLSESIADGVLSFQELSERKHAPKMLAEYRSQQLPLMATVVDPSADAVRAALSYMSLVPVSNAAGVFRPGIAGAPPVGSDAWR